MAITDKEKGVWGLDQVYNKINQGSIWEYSSTLNNLYAWGQNDGGELAQNNRTKYSSPVQIPGTTWKSVAMQQYVAYATKTDGTLWSWAYGSVGSLGLNQPATTKLSSPTQIGSLTDWNVVPFQSDGGNMIAHKEV